MEQSNQFFETAKPTRLFVKVAVPGLVSMLAMSLYFAFEGVFVGHLIGEAAFAAINLGMPIVFINNALSDMIGVGSEIPISVALGKKDYKKANNVFTCSIILIVLVAIVMGLMVFFAAPFFTKLMGADGEMARLAIRYVRVYAVLGPVTTIVFAMDNYLRISGFVKGSMFLNIFMSILNLAFLALLLASFKMNVEGAALATCMAMFICALIALVPFVRKKAVLKFVKPQISLAMIREIVACGAPTFLHNISGKVASILINSALIRNGGQTAVAAYSVLMYVASVIEPMLFGMCDSVSPALGYNWGAGQTKRVRDIEKVNFTVCGIVSVFCSAVMFLFPQALTQIFVDAAETELMEMTIHAIPMFGIAFMFGWFGFGVQRFFVSIEKPLPATVLSICRAMVFPVILIYGLSWMGLDGLWLNYTGTAVLATITASIMLIMIQKKIKLK